MNVRGFVKVEGRGHPISLVLPRGPRNCDAGIIKAWAGDSQWRAFRADLAHFREFGYSGWGSGGLWALVIHRLQSSSPVPTPMALDAHSFDVWGRKQVVYDGDPH
jgi:hypothetical protein